jgi:hypothetical protein
MKNKNHSNQTKAVLVCACFILITLSGYKAFAQPEPFEFFVRIGNDPNMAISGAYPDREDKAIGLHNKYGFGFEWENVRIGMDVESFSAIGFTKWTYLYGDYKIIIDHTLTIPIIGDVTIRNVNLFGGLEISQIKRHHPDFDGNNRNNYREYTTNPLLFGANGEILFRKENSNFAFGLQGNIHQAEDELKAYKKFRKQVFINIYFYF